MVLGEFISLPLLFIMNIVIIIINIINIINTFNFVLIVKLFLPQPMRLKIL